MAAVETGNHETAGKAGKAGGWPSESQAGATDLLLSDLRFALVLMNELRYRTFARLFGISRDQANLVSLIALVLMAQRINETRATLAAGVPSSGEGVLAAASMREALCSVAGPASRNTPVTGTLLTIAVLLGFRPPVKKAVRVVGAQAHRAGLGFHRRYGWIVDPGHLRQRRAQRRSSRAGSIATGGTPAT